MIDWNKQWEIHSPQFHQGYVHIGGLRLRPGPGFGDLSHPTTRIMLRLMEDQVKGRDVIDIGCGSGILSLVAKKSGAHRVFGVDIDPDAVEHSKLNARFNQLDIHFSLDLPKSLAKVQNPIILMNMIEQDQASVWPLLTGYTDEMIVSGMMVERKEGYLLKRTELQHSKELQLDNWIGLSSYR